MHISITRAGTIGTRFPQSCPDDKPGFCFNCNDNRCHTCWGYGSITTEYDYATCPGCGGSGELDDQLLGLSDPQAAESAWRAQRGLQP